MDYVDEDIFSINGISFGSPIQDILLKSTFTLEELLEQDDLLQETKSLNTRLIDFLCEDAVISKLLEYVVVPARSDANEFQKFKYPYMSCEVICLEIPLLVQKLVNHPENIYLLKLFSLLDNPAPLDNYLGGYFEKILEMLFRKETDKIMTFINSGGISLFRRFLNHIENYSIMQLAQRLMLPHIPFSSTNNTTDEILEQSNNETCQWSLSEDYLDLLSEKMIQNSHPEVSAHISDLLITVIQLTLSDSNVISNFCKPARLQNLLEVTFSTFDETEDGSSLSAISVLESLISRLGESLGPETEQNNEDYYRLLSFTKGCIDNVAQKIVNFFPIMVIKLKSFASSENREQIKLQSKRSFFRLGNKGLQLVKLVESLIRLDCEIIDKKLCEQNIIKVIIDLMFHFEHNSILHLSIQRIISTIIQSGNKERFSQKHLLVDSGLVNILIDYITKDSKFSNDRIAGSKSPVLGHLIAVAQIMINVIKVEEESNFTIESVEQSCPIISILKDSNLYESWSYFVQTVLSQYLDKQVTSSADILTGHVFEGSNMSHIESSFGMLNLNEPDEANWKFLQSDYNTDNFSTSDFNFGMDPNGSTVNFADFANFEQFPDNGLKNHSLSPSNYLDEIQFSSFTNLNENNLFEKHVLDSKPKVDIFNNKLDQLSTGDKIKSNNSTSDLFKADGDLDASQLSSSTSDIDFLFDLLSSQQKENINEIHDVI